MPPFPTPLYFPFHSASGNQTSKFIAGSVTPVTLQKAGVFRMLSRPGCLKLLASITSANEMVVFCKFAELLASDKHTRRRFLSSWASAPCIRPSKTIRLKINFGFLKCVCIMDVLFFSYF